MMRTSRALTVLSTAFALASVVLAFGFVGVGTGNAPSTGPTHPVAAVPTGPHGVPAPHPPLGGPPASGPGTFFLNYPLPTVPTAHDECVYKAFCVNDTAGPSIATDAAGLIAVAYTAFGNVSVCPGDWNLTTSEVGVEVSSNNGSTWSSPVYLANPDCTTQFTYSSAMWPSITVIPNGTMVMAFVEYNLSVAPSSACSFSQYYWWPDLLPCMVPHDRLVVTQSFNGGTTWTVPQTIDAASNTGGNITGPMPWMPVLASLNDTVYLAWDNLYNAAFASYLSPPSPSAIVVDLNLTSSTNGGLTWGSTVTVPAINNTIYGKSTSVAYAPSLAIAPNGTLYIAYSSNETGNSTLACIGSYGCTYNYPTTTMDIIVASTSNGGATFSLHTAARKIAVSWNGISWIYSGPSDTVGPAPAVAVDPATGNLYVAYTGDEVGVYCYTFGCYLSEGWDGLYVSTSTNGGATWTNDTVGGSLIGALNLTPAQNALMTPSIGVGSGGTVWVDAAYQQGIRCSPYCNNWWSGQVFESTNHGSSFQAYTPDPTARSQDYYPFTDGFATSMAFLDGQPWFAWTQNSCPANVTYCNFGLTGGATGYSYVVVSTPFNGTGITLSFSPSGIVGPANWSIDLSGNIRAGPTSGPLNVSRVPTNSPLSWTATWVNTSTYGVSFQPGNSTPRSGSSFTANTSVTVAYTERVLVNIATIPLGYAGYTFTCPALNLYNQYCTNQNVTPSIGGHWVSRGSVLAYGINQLSPFSFQYCFFCDNLSFLSWTGVGNGSWNSTVANGTAIINGPVNETASFHLIDVCDYGTCYNVTYNYAFVEHGLPTGTLWQVSLGNQVGSSTTPGILFNATSGPLPFTIWTVPVNATYSYVGVPSFPSPITSTQGGQEVVTFTLQRNSLEASTLTVSAAGLPAGVTSWGFDLGTASLSAPAGNSTYTVSNGATTFNASSVYGQGGTGGYIASFTVAPEVVGATTITVSPGGSYTVLGPAFVTANYAPEYWVTVDHTAGGTVSQPPGQWVHSGGALTLTAAPLTGFNFVGWSGTGPGSQTGSTLAITVHPAGPITELATFVAIVPTYSLTVSASGIPGAVPVTLQVGGTTYTETAPFTVSGLVAGSYSLSAPTVYPNATAGTRYELTGLSSSLPLSAGSVTVSANGTIALTYAAQYALTVAPTANGTTSPVAGSYWEAGGVPTELTATPAFGFNFAGWIGTGPGAVTDALNATVNVTLTAPVTESASFSAVIHTPPATFTLTLTETGLPTGTLWSASSGSFGGSSTTNTLVVAGLNGSYTFTVPDAFGAPGVRYAPSGSATLSENVTLNATGTVAFTTEYLVTVSSSPGGTVTPGSGWFASGSSVSLTATPNDTTYAFVGWNGTGTGAYTGTTASSSFTATGPVTEIATFVLKSTQVQPSTTSSSGSPYLAIGVLVGLLAVGLVIGLLIGRSRPPSGPRAPPAEEGAAPAEAGGLPPVWQEPSAGEGAPTDESGTAGGDQEEQIYGGGSA